MQPMLAERIMSGGCSPKALTEMPASVLVLQRLARSVPQLPLLIVAGLFTRLAALGMLGFIVVQSMTDIWGHGIMGDDLGRWFDAASGALILDQRSLWAFLLMTLFFTGAGPISLDRLLLRSRTNQF